MSQTDIQYLGTTLLANVDHSFGTLELNEFISREGDVKLAFARALEVEASKIMFKFSAGDTSIDKSVYAGNLLKIAQQVRRDYATYQTDVSEIMTWSGSAAFGSAEAETWIDTDYLEPDIS